MSAGKWLGQGKRNEPHFGVLSGGIGDFEIGQKPISNPKSEISNWTASWRGRECNLRFRISDLRWAFVQFRNLFLRAGESGLIPISSRSGSLNLRTFSGEPSA